VISVTYLSNTQGYCPVEAPLLREKIESLLGRRPVIVRVSSREIHLYTPTPIGRSEEEALWRWIAPPSSQKEPACPGRGISRILCRYTALIQLERYWEAHEVGEDLWRLGFPAGQLMAVWAGVLARAQEGDLGAVETILDRVLPAVAGGQAGVGVPLDVGRLREAAYQVIACSPATVPLLTPDPPLLSYRRK